MEIENLIVLKNQIEKVYNEYITFCSENAKNIINEFNIYRKYLTPLLSRLERVCQGEIVEFVSNEKNKLIEAQEVAEKLLCISEMFPFYSKKNESILLLAQTIIDANKIVQTTCNDMSGIVNLHIKIDKFKPSVIRILNSKDKKTIGQIYTAKDTNNWSTPFFLPKEHLMLLKAQDTQIFKVVVYKIDREPNECKVVEFSISNDTTNVKIFVEVLLKNEIEEVPEDLQNNQASEALYISFPDYQIETPLGYMTGLGHAGVLLISPNGKTVYYEYGRYDSQDLGLVRRNKKPISNVIIGKDGLATKESLQTVLKEISNQAGKSGKIKAIYFKNMDFEKMNAYAMKKFIENKDKNRTPYSLSENNCGTFAYDVIKQSPNAKKLSDKALPKFSSPINIVEELDKKHQHINYNPKTDIIQLEDE